jgi:iron complex outermembrane receptor protein
MDKFIFFVALMVCLSLSNILGQPIQLLDQKAETPIINASYQYGNQQGISDNKGNIAINYEPNSSLELSHIYYGFISFKPSEVEAILKQGKYLWQNREYELQPVSIIAFHQPIADSLSVLFNNQNRMSHDASALLAQMPEIALIRKSRNYGFDPVLRGFKYDQLNIVMDGAQSANAACPNRMDPPSSQMPVNMLSQISILKGPYSLRYGNAFGGTINFQTTPPRFGTDQAVSGRLSGTYESNGSIYRSEGLIGFNGKSHDIKVYGSLSTGDNYEDGNGHEVLSSFSRNNIGTSMAFKLNHQQDIRLNVSHNYAKDVDFPALPMDLRKDDTWLGSLHHSIRFNKRLIKWTTSIYSTYVDHLMDNFNKNINPRMVDAETAAKTYNYGGRTEGQWLFGSHQLYAGLDFRADKAEGERSRHFLMGPNRGRTVYDNVWQDAYINKASVFAEFQQVQDKWRLVYSARVEYNNADADKPDTNFSSHYNHLSSNTINPAISFGIKRQLNSRLSAELWLGHAERSGSLSERYINFLPVGVDPYEMLGNPDLDSEKNNQVDLSLNYKSGTSNIQITGFMALMNDYISSEIREDISPKMPSSPGVRQFTNIDEARLMGFEAVWLQQLPAKLQHRLSVAYTYGKNNETDEALPEIAPMDFRYLLSGYYLDGKMRPELSLRHVLKQNRIAESFGETKTPAFTLVDVSMNYAINQHLELTASANNLFDETYYEHLTRSVKGSSQAIYAPGRSFVFTIVSKL